MAIERLTNAVKRYDAFVARTNIFNPEELPVIVLPGAQAIKLAGERPDWDVVEKEKKIDAIAQRRAEELVLALAIISAPYTASFIGDAKSRDRNGLFKKVRPGKEDASSRETDWYFPAKDDPEYNPRQPQYHFRIRYTHTNPPFNKRFGIIAKRFGQEPELPTITVNRAIIEIDLPRAHTDYQTEQEEEKSEKNTLIKKTKRLIHRLKKVATGEEFDLGDYDHSRALLTLFFDTQGIAKARFDYLDRDIDTVGKLRKLLDGSPAKQLLDNICQTQGYSREHSYSRERDSFPYASTFTLDVRGLPHARIDQRVIAGYEHLLSYNDRPKNVEDSSFARYKQRITSNESEDLETALASIDQHFETLLKAVLAITTPNKPTYSSH